MNKFKLTALISGVLLLLFIAACSNEEEKESDSNNQSEIDTTNITYAATAQSSGFYPYNVAIADIINDHVNNVNVTVSETGGTVDNLDLMEKGEAQLGQGADIDLYMGLNELGAFEGEEFDNSRMLIAAHPNGYFFTVTENSEVNSLSDLDGINYSPGLQGSITEVNTHTFITDTLGYEPNYVPGTLDDAVSAIKDRRLDGVTRVAATVSPDSAIQDMETAVDMKVLSFTDEEIDKVINEFPFLSKTTIDGSVYNQDEDIATIGGYFGTMISKDMPDDVVYDMAEAIFENQDYIAESYKGVKGFDLVELTLESGTWLHPGVVKYLQDQGHDVPDKLIPPEMD